jgi:integrase
MRKAKLTKSIVEDLSPGAGNDIAWDTVVPGFGARITETGRRTYFLKYRTKAGQQRKPKIGDHGPITCDQARAIAREWYMEAKSGGDPSAERSLSRAGETIADLCDQYHREHSLAHKKPKSVFDESRMIEKVVKPQIGRKKVSELGRPDIVKLHKSLAGTPFTANRVLSLLSHMMTMAMKWGLRPEGVNPCKGIPKFKEKAKERYLSPEEIDRLFAVLDDVGVDDPVIAALFKLSVMTGARRGELLNLKWSEVDLRNRRFKLLDSKTGPKIIHLSGPAAAVVQGIHPVHGNPYVFPGRIDGKPLVSVKKAWDSIRKKAGIQDARIHDLRHTFASIGVQNGIPLFDVGKLMGHRSLSTTARYAHLLDKNLTDAVDRIASKIKRTS